MEDPHNRQVQELQAQIAELRRRNLIYENAVSAIADGFFIVDRDGIILEMNKAYCDYLGINREETIGKHVNKVIYNSRMADVIESKTTEIDSMHQFLDGQTPTGEKAIAVSRMPVMDGGEVIGAVALAKFSRYTIMLANNLRKLEEEVQYYRKELRKHAIYSLQPAELPCASPAMEEAKRLAVRFASNDMPLLLLGETGVGKAVFANAVHHGSDRREGRFISLNCASIPAELLEAELFGHEEGAQAGPHKGARKGKFELANGGTLFLDEIGDMPLPLQGRLLNMLQAAEAEVPADPGKRIPLNVRIITATSQELSQKVEEKLFRPDLLYRLNVLTISIPPLRERKEDIPVLAAYFLEELNNRYGRSVALAAQTLAILEQYDWPGNVRELRNAIGRGFMLTEGNEVLPQHLPSNIYDEHKAKVQELLPDTKMRKERDMIINCLSSFGGNMTRAAKALGMHRSTLYTKIAALGIPKTSYRSKSGRKGQA